MGKTQAKGGISLQQACSTIIKETSKRLARVVQHAWGNVAYIETQQIHSLKWVGWLVRGRWRFKLLTTCAVGVKKEGVALAPGKSLGSRSKEPKTGSKDRYKRKREEGAKGKESMDHEGNKGVENIEGGRSGAETNSQQNPSNSTQNQNNEKQKQSASTSYPSPPSRMIKILTVNIDGHSKAKGTYLCNLSCFKTLDIIIMTKHHLSSTFCPVEIVESGWSIQQVAGLQKRRSRQHEYRGGVAILTRDEVGLHVKQTRVIDGSSASPHQAVS